MTQIDSQEIRRLHQEVSAALRRWEEDPRQVTALRTTTAQVQAQLDEWKDAGAYQSSAMRLLWDHLAHVNARLELARQQATRGY